ncbi:hypothetical protein NFX31_06020 [Microbacterium azadirachtae]|uniref:hypothetical protein n=1 Tax=Microbacterium azadirachtae TaxID=582680 RepID=UPI0021D4EC90|nr:hypothetical protein [Microbacterium azadirachtae]UXW87078.1 hypothetical protein NFX31_06020 [Microbacterium azadirachtae]
MDFDKFETPDGIEIRVPTDESYRSCVECGGDCYPNAIAADGLGMRIGFVCPEHGLQGIVDPFHDLR